MQITTKLVRNFSSGRKGYRPEAIVLHIAQGYLAGAYSWFNNPSSYASAHYMVGRRGEIWQFVRDQNTAWHAGGVNKPNWSLLKPNTNPNLYTLSIEHEGFTGERWTNEMSKSSTWLIAELCKRWNIPADRNHIIGHYQINSVTRKNCPGTGVDFARIIKQVNALLAPTEPEEDPEVIKELQAQIKTLQARIQLLEGNNADLLAEIKSIRHDNQVLTQRLNDLRLENETLKSYLGRSNSDSSNELLSHNRKLAREVQTLADERRQLLDRIARLEQTSSTQPATKAQPNKSFGELLTDLVNKIVP